MNQFAFCCWDMLIIVLDFHGLISSTASQPPDFLKYQGLVDVFVV